MPVQQHTVWQPSYLPGTRTQRRNPLLEWWYALTAPPSTKHSPSFRMQEATRRARLTSSVALVEITLIFITIAIVFRLRYVTFVPLQLAALCLLAIALLCNRLQRRQIANVLIVGVSELDVVFILIQSMSVLHPHQVFSLSFCFYLLLPELLTVLLLPPGMIFLIVCFNSVCAWFMLCFLTRTAFSIDTANYQSYFMLLILYWSLALLCYLWASSIKHSLLRADSVEVVAALEHTMAQHEHAVAQQKRALDQSIAEIMQTHLQVANGDFHARVPLTQEDILWPIAGSLNTLLARIQRLGRESARLEKTEQAAAQLAMALRAMRAGGAPIVFQRSGTAVDLIILELATTVETETNDGQGL